MSLTTTFQANESTILHFITPNWPDIGVADVLPPLLSYQAEVWVEQFSKLFRRLPHAAA